MSNLIPEKLALLGRAAELRATGAAWVAVATELKVADDELRTLRAANTHDYNRLARRAEREFEREAARASLARLRELLKSTEDGVAMLAAGTIIRYELARMRHEVQAERNDQQRRFQKLRNELPPLPSSRLREQMRTVTRGVTGRHPRRKHQLNNELPLSRLLWKSCGVTVLPQRV